MPRGGTLVIETINAHLDAQYAGRHFEVTPGDYVGLIVTDSGSGMEADVLARAFEPFFTTKEPGRGTGLGLSMVYGLVKQSGGHVTIDSEIGRGTSVKIYLPRAAAPDPSRPATGDTPLLGGKPTETVLVVDDDAAVREVAVEMLSDLGDGVEEAEDGHSALAMLAANPDIDLIFTDLIMPSGMSGYELFVAAWEKHPHLKVLFTSGYSEHSLATQSKFERQMPLLGKPYRRQKLAEMVRAVLDAT